MTMRIVLTFLLVSAVSFADDVPAGPIAEKKELLFSDDFEGAEPAKAWRPIVPTFVLENGSLKGTQTRDQDVPASEGKRALAAHPAVHGLEVPTKDSVVELRVRFEGASMVDVEFIDRTYAGSHSGHICRAQFRLDGVALVDERDGKMRNDIREMMKDPERKSEVDKLLVGRRASIRLKLEPGRWYGIGVETVGEEMRATIDGKPVCYLKSSGIAHATKTQLLLGVAGKDAFFDDLRVWNAEPAKR